MRSRVWRIAAVSAAFVVAGGPAAFAQDAAGDVLVASGEPPVVATAEPVEETGTVYGAVVAVGLPPVPPPVVAVDTPPVPSAPVVAVDTPPAASDPVVVESGRPPLADLPDAGRSEAEPADVAGSIAGAVAAVAVDAWRD